ncbi:AraC family transcriptional regulator [Rhodococcus sp. ABRD24]|uniref:helix-turn-helix domain-containing protein n=1 Tax=Rhodococcus sp. ABRD24 TaxID=2507582 RepID=UPI0013F15142|nr:AraC family transcriptional regulator [Rhodococcus sp. ABRD24]
MRSFTRTSDSRFALLDVDLERLSLPASLLRRMAFTPIVLSSHLQTLFVGSVRHAVTLPSDQTEGADMYLTGLADVVLRAALGREIDHSDTAEMRRVQAIRYMERHLSESSLDADTVAGALMMSRRTLFAAFAASEHGDTPMVYLRRLRMDQAMRLLTGGPATIREIAHACGFVSNAHFTRTFVKHAGQTPTEFRLANRPSRRARH